MKNNRSIYIRAAVLASGWYLLHPANAEMLNYIYARYDSIFTLWVVLALINPIVPYHSLFEKKHSGYNNDRFQNPY